MLVETLHFNTIEGASAAATEDRHLVAGFVDGAIPIDAFGNGERRPVRARGSN